MLAAIAALVLVQQPVDQPKEVRAPIVGVWSVDTKYGYAQKMIEFGIHVDWLITFKEDGTFVWAAYDPYKEGVGRKHRDTKGTYVVNLDANILAIKTTHFTNKPATLKCLLDEHRKSFVIPSMDPEIFPEHKFRFFKLETKKD
jgi:hypothetical protein